MAKDQWGAVIRHLGGGALGPDGAGATDARLLECFLSRRDGGPLRPGCAALGRWSWGWKAP